MSPRDVSQQLWHKPGSTEDIDPVTIMTSRELVGGRALKDNIDQIKGSKSRDDVSKHNERASVVELTAYDLSHLPMHAATKSFHQLLTLSPTELRGLGPGLQI